MAPCRSRCGVEIELRHALGLTHREAEVLLAWWTRRPEYRAALAAPGSLRHALDGTPVGPVSDQRRANAVTGYARPRPQMTEQMAAAD
jgi:hypothetical protein